MHYSQEVFSHASGQLNLVSHGAKVTDGVVLSSVVVGEIKWRK